MLKQNSQNSPGSIDPIVASGLKDVLPSRQRPSHFTVNSQISTIASVKPSFQIDVLLFGKTQVFLQIATDGTVNGTSDCRSEYGRRCSQSKTIPSKQISPKPCLCHDQLCRAWIAVYIIKNGAWIVEKTKLLSSHLLIKISKTTVNELDFTGL